MLFSFYAFHVNAMTNLIYMFSNNFWLVFLFISTILTSIFYLKEEVEQATPEKQDIV